MMLLKSYGRMMFLGILEVHLSTEVSCSVDYHTQVLSDGFLQILFLVQLFDPI